MRDMDGSVAQCLQTRLHRTVGQFHPLCSWSTSGGFYLSGGAERTNNPRKRMACRNTFQCFLSKFCHMAKFNNNKVTAKKVTFKDNHRPLGNFAFQNSKSASVNPVGCTMYVLHRQALRHFY